MWRVVVQPLFDPQSQPYPSRSCRQFLSRVADVLEEYVGAPLSEHFLKAHFVSVHEVVEEMMDGGIPLVTEPNALKV